MTDQTADVELHDDLVHLARAHEGRRLWVRKRHRNLGGNFEIYGFGEANSFGEACGSIAL